MKDVLVHICCGVCGSSAIDRLKEEGFNVTAFFYNPNIYPQEEYERRLEVCKKVAKILDFKLIEGEYDKDNWFRLTEGLKDEPEGGRRCEECFKIRLIRSFKKCKELNLPYFTTTLTVSPHKNASIINKIGKELSREKFLERDFKKRDGFKKAIDFSNKYNIYRQNYCGCVYSL